MKESDRIIHDQELEQLREQIDSFKEEKERIRSIVGQIGGVPSTTKKIYDILFVVIVIAALGAALGTHGILQMASIEFAIAFLSLKIIYLMRAQARVNHFQLWILTSLEWRINELTEKINSRFD